MKLEVILHDELWYKVLAKKGIYVSEVKKSCWIEWKQPCKLKNASNASTGEFLKLV